MSAALAYKPVVSLNFTRLAAGLNVAPMLQALDRNPELWGEITMRQSFPGSAHRDTEAIFVRWSRSLDLGSAFTDLDAVDYPAASVLPVSPLYTALLDAIGDDQDLGRVMLVKLKPGGYVTPHVDEGPYADHYERFHVVLSANPGNVFGVADETAEMRPGEAWWFNHKRKHWVRNGSGAPRIHMIADVQSPRFRVER